MCALCLVRFGALRTESQRIVIDLRWQRTRRYPSAAVATYGNIVEWNTVAISWMYYLFYNQMTGSWKSFYKTLIVCATLMSVSEQHTCPCSPP